MDNILKALKEFSESAENLKKATNEISNRDKIIDEAIKKEIEERKRKAEDLLNRIKF